MPPEVTSLSLPILNLTFMSLVPGYSSDEDEGTSMSNNDAFGISNLPTAKKIRIDEPELLLKPQAAPHVLAEVRCSYFVLRQDSD